MNVALHAISLYVYFYYVYGAYFHICKIVTFVAFVDELNLQLKELCCNLRAYFALCTWARVRDPRERRDIPA